MGTYFGHERKSKVCLQRRAIYVELESSKDGKSLLPICFSPFVSVQISVYKRKNWSGIVRSGTARIDLPAAANEITSLE